MNRALIGRNTVMISVLVISCLLIAGATIFRHGVTLYMGNSMKYVTGRELLVWTATVLLLIIVLATAWSIWRR